MEAVPIPRPNRRAAQSAQTRRLIVATALELFVSDGFVPTTIGRLATECGVAVQTIYNSVGNKTEILSAVIDLAAAGDDAPATPLEFLGARLEATSSPAEIAHVLADWFTEVNRRMAPVYRVLTDAAALDPAAAVLKRARDNQRFERYLLTGPLLRARGGLLGGLDDQGVAALIWSAGHPQTHGFLTGERGWDDARYSDWCRTALLAAFA